MLTSGSVNYISKNIDKTLAFLVLAISCFGIIMISSAVRSFDNSIKYIVVQTVSLILGAAIVFFIAELDYENLAGMSKYLYGGSIILLILVLTPLGTGREETGGQSWFRLGFVGIQPAEIVKIAFIITFARHLDYVKDTINEIKNVALLLLHIGILIILIQLQPDAGTSMVFVFVAFCMMFVAGLSYKYIIGCVVAFAASAPLLWFFVLQEYQKKRILSLLYPEQYSLGSGYQVIQAKIAIGSGQIFGKGLFSGTQTQLGILPEKQTDFIFAVIGEELGMVGCIFVFLLLFAIIARCIYIAKTSNVHLGKFICVGVAAMLLFQSFENIGMSLGLTPVAGITLPFLSYGGSSLFANIVAVGIVMNISKRNRVY